MSELGYFAAATRNNGFARIYLKTWRLFAYQYVECVRRFLAISSESSVILTDIEQYCPKVFDLTTNHNLEGRDA
jgi:hypothetical protein